MKKQKDINKTLYNALHEQPETFEIKLDIDGYTDVDELISKLDEKGVKVSVNDIKRTIKESGKGQINASKDGSKIRINPLTDINSNERR
jgi:putative RNA 2'-phosphotransferase